MNTPLTTAQKRTLEIFVRFYLENGYGPTLRELMDALGFTSTNAPGELLERLERKGFLERPGPRGRQAHSRGLIPTAAGVAAVEPPTSQFIPAQRCELHELTHFAACPACRKVRGF